MKPGFAAGLSAELVEQTTEEHRAPHLDAGLPSVYSTPSMIALMERTSNKLVHPYLEEGEASVGTKVNISHIAATPIGVKVRAKSTVRGINGRRITFDVEAYNEKEKIGEGTHERAIVNVQKFSSKS